MQKNSKISVLGGTGLVGSAVVRRLKAKGYENIDAIGKESGINLMKKEDVDEYFKKTKPDYVFMVAGLVGGIYANMTRGADFLYQNAIMILNVYEGIKNFCPKAKIMFFGSTCIYPKDNPQPINESRFLQGALEETNKGYAIAKIMGIVASELYRKQYGISSIAVMPTNMYGPGDNYDIQNGHMIPTLIKKFYDAKQSGESITLWGTGKPRREALFVEDCADACIHLMNTYDDPKIVNIGTGFDYSIREFADMLQQVLDFKADIKWDDSKPDGVLEKRTDISYLRQLMPDYSPRSFVDGAKVVLEKDFSAR